jgi:Fic family protein
VGGVKLTELFKNRLKKNTIFEPIATSNRLNMYNWQHKKWPYFEFDLSRLEKQLMQFMLKTGELSGVLAALPKDIGIETIIEILVSEAIKTTQIEGEIINRKEVMSSIKKNLGIKIEQEPSDKHVIGLSNMLIDQRNTFRQKLTEEKLLLWHRMLMENYGHVNAGKWRVHQESMQVISGSAAHPKVHFEAPPSKDVPKEMQSFIDWFNAEHNTYLAPPVKAAIAHVYFESIHPFEDGNGRIGRAIAEKALSQGLDMPILFSISGAIEARRSEYYAALQKAQQTLNITEWIHWFVEMVLTAQINAEKMLQFTVFKVQFFDQYNNQFNDRQKKVINRMFAEAPNKFQGGINVKKYISLTSVSKATATRDLQQLVEMRALTVIGAGRSTRYDISGSPLNHFNQDIL